jgi:hypothetical protein
MVLEALTDDAEADARGATLGPCEQGPTEIVKSAAPSLILP